MSRGGAEGESGPLLSLFLGLFVLYFAGRMF